MNTVHDDIRDIICDGLKDYSYDKIVICVIPNLITYVQLKLWFNLWSSVDDNKLHIIKINLKNRPISNSIQIQVLKEMTGIL